MNCKKQSGTAHHREYGEYRPYTPPISACQCILCGIQNVPVGRHLLDTDRAQNALTGLVGAPPLQVLTQKLKLHFIVNGIVSLVPSVVLSIMLGMKPVNIIITILIPIIFSLFSGLLGLMFDLKKPKLDWNTTAEAVKQSSSVMLSLLLSVLAVCVPAIAYPVLLKYKFFENFLETFDCKLFHRLQIFGGLFLILIFCFKDLRKPLFLYS